MKLWTIQDYSFWATLQADGMIYSNITEPKEFELPYNWMASQMYQKIGSPENSEIKYPLWAWYQWKDSENKMPDLRYSGHLQKGRRGVRIEFEIDSTNVLLSDFNLWHYPLNGWYLGNDKAVGQEITKLQKTGITQFYGDINNFPPDLFQTVTTSWENIFDFNWYSRLHGAGNIQKQCIQATFWQLSIDNVCRVKEFIAR